MAKTRKNDVVDDSDVAVLDNTKTVNWQEVALFNQKKAEEALERVTKLEDLLAAMMPDLRVSSKYLNGLQVHAGVRIEDYYRQARDLLGERGLQIDKGIRGA